MAGRSAQSRAGFRCGGAHGRTQRVCSTAGAGRASCDADQGPQKLGPTGRTPALRAGNWRGGGPSPPLSGGVMTNVRGRKAGPAASVPTRRRGRHVRTSASPSADPFAFTSPRWIDAADHVLHGVQLARANHDHRTAEHATPGKVPYIHLVVTVEPAQRLQQTRRV
jgi:hypothetical protein